MRGKPFGAVKKHIAVSGFIERCQSLGRRCHFLGGLWVLGRRPEIVERSVRFRTLGCFPLTGAVESEAATLDDVIQEMLLTTTSERQGRVIDRDGGDASMEKKKAEGYF